MPKIHELLAAEATVAANYNRDLTETVHVLGKPELFTDQVATKTHFSEEDEHLNTSEHKAITTTVRDRLKWFTHIAAKYYDVQFQKDLSNHAAKADLVVGTKTIAKGVPATTLLMLESKLQDLRRVLEAAPTLAAGVDWKLDPTTNLHKMASAVVTFFTKKVTKPVVLYAATDKHPAQVKEVTEDVSIGKIERMTASGMLSSAEKADLLGRLDDLLQGTKMARQRANAAEASVDKIGEAIVGFVLG